MQINKTHKPIGAESERNVNISLGSIFQSKSHPITRNVLANI